MLNDYVQLEFPFTDKGKMQQYAIMQDCFIHKQYHSFLSSCFGSPTQYLSYKDFELIHGPVIMKYFRDIHNELHRNDE